MKKLEFHADVSHKVPVFLVQFLKDDILYAIVDVKNIDDLFYGLKGIKPNTTSVDIASIKEEIDIASTSKEKKEKINKKEKREIEAPIIKTSKSSRDSFFREQEKSRKNFKKGIYK